MHLELVLHQFLGPGLLPWGNTLYCFSASCDISAFTQGKIWFLFGPEPRSDFFLANESLKCPLLPQHEERSGCMCSSKRQNSQATILKLGNERRHLRFYRMYWWQLISKGYKNRPEFLGLRNIDIFGLMILYCVALSSESDYKQHPGPPPTTCQQHPHSRHDNQDDSGHCQIRWEAKIIPKWEPPK